MHLKASGGVKQRLESLHPPGGKHASLINMSSLYRYKWTDCLVIYNKQTFRMILQKKVECKNKKKQKKKQYFKLCEKPSVCAIFVCLSVRSEWQLIPAIYSSLKI